MHLLGGVEINQSHAVITDGSIRAVFLVGNSSQWNGTHLMIEDVIIEAEGLLLITADHVRIVTGRYD